MSIHRLGMLGAAALGLWIVPGQAGPCSPDIDRMQARVDGLIAATAAAGPVGRESRAATTHHQPTPGSIAAAEERLGDGARIGRGEACCGRLVR